MPARIDKGNIVQIRVPCVRQVSPRATSTAANALGKDVGTVKVMMLRMFRDGQLLREGGRYWASKRNPGNPVTEE